MFVHVTVVPTATLSSAGLKARFPRNSARMGIATDAVGAVGAGAVGVGAAGAGATGAGVSVGETGDDE